MSAVILSCTGCGVAAPAASKFCHACGAPFPSPRSALRVVRGRILRDTNAGAGMLSVDGRQLAFSLEQHWRGQSAPQVDMSVEVTLDAEGAPCFVTPVSDAMLAREGLSEVGGIVAGLASRYAPAGRQLAVRIGKPVLAATGVLALSWLWLPAVSIRLNAFASTDLSLFKVLALANSANSLDGIGTLDGASSGFYGFLAFLALVAPLAAAVLRHRLAPLASCAPLAFMLVTGLAGWLKLRGLASQATEGARAFGGRQGEEMVAAMLAQVMKAVSLGYGSYIALAAALALAWFGLRRLIHFR